MGSRVPPCPTFFVLYIRRTFATTSKEVIPFSLYIQIIPDITGKVLSTCDAYVSRNKMPMIERIFTGEQLQTPPMYSAVKVNGQRLYDLARKGEVVNRQPRKINIYEMKTPDLTLTREVITAPVSSFCPISCIKVRM